MKSFKRLQGSGTKTLYAVMAVLSSMVLVLVYQSRVTAVDDQRFSAASADIQKPFPPIVSSTNREGPNNDMLDLFEELLRSSKVPDPRAKIAETMQNWRRTSNQAVRFTRHESTQMEAFVNRVMDAKALSPAERAVHIARAMDYKMQYEIQEAWDRELNWRDSAEEMMAKIRMLDVKPYGRVVKEFPSQSDYVVIVIEMFHRGLGEGMEPEIIDVQREIATLEDMLIDNGISNVLAIEGSEIKEIAFELLEPPRAGNLVEYRDFMECTRDVDNPGIHDLLAGWYGGSLWQEGLRRDTLHTFGVETREIHDKAATYNLLTKELVGLLKDLSFFGEGFGEGDDSGRTFSKGPLISRLKRTLRASGSEKETVHQAMSFLEDIWEGKDLIRRQDIVEAARNAHERMWRFAIHARNRAFPSSIEQIRENTLTNAIMFVVGVYHNEKIEEGMPTLTDRLLAHNISHIVFRPHTVQSLLDKTH